MQQLYSDEKRFKFQFSPVEDDRLSFESRSLTAFSNFSGRDSVMDGSVHNSYRYPYANDPVVARGHHENTVGLPDPPQDKPNPFERGGDLSREANVVIQTFLQNGAGGVGSAAHAQSGGGRYADSAVSSAAGMSTSASYNSPNGNNAAVGKLEDLDSPVSPYNQTDTNLYMNMDHIPIASPQSTSSR